MNVDAETQTSQTQEQTEQTQTDQTQTQTEGEQTEEQKSLVEGEQKAEAAEFVPLTPEDITFPEGFEVSETRRDEALSIINNRDLSPKDQLQALVNLQAEVAKEASEAISETWAQTQKTWQDEVKADPTIGGDKLSTTLAAVNKLVTEYGDDKLVEAFALTGAGNNVHVIKFLHSIAGKLLEGGPVPAGSPINQESSAAERMFPSMKKG